jgi:hypothetical protein
VSRRCALRATFRASNEHSVLDRWHQQNYPLLTGKTRIEDVMWKA